MTFRDAVGRWLQAQWYGGSAPHPLLLPLEGLFRMAAERRRRAYREGRKPVARLPVPVIVVGNLSVGGAGKTPLTIWLARFLQSRGYRPGVVSRGYGGAVGARPVAVDAAADPRRAGDEPVLIARRAHCPVYAHPRRALAAEALLAATACDIVIADDGLQHYALARDLEIAVVDGARRLGNGRCLPAGPLREPPERLCAVDLVVYTGAEAADGGGYPMALEGGEAESLLDPGRRRPLADFAGRSVFAMAGIGNPQRFFDHLRRYGLEFEGREFPDHHGYRREDLAFADGADLLMTEKDAVKCRAFAGPGQWQVPVEARLPEAFGEHLLTLLKAKRDERKTA
jgi:tetraacyldisaccharide 4'-kinase